MDRDEDEQPPNRLTHVTEGGDAKLVDIGAKSDRRRRAVASGCLRLQPETIEAIASDELSKGDVLPTVRIGAIQAVKHTWEAIPLCHQIPITDVETDIDLETERVRLTVAVETLGKTGCEMEALHGVSTGLNVLWDMTKAAEKDAHGQYPDTRIEEIEVTEKFVEGRPPQKA